MLIKHERGHSEGGGRVSGFLEVAPMIALLVVIASSMLVNISQRRVTAAYRSSSEKAQQQLKDAIQQIDGLLNTCESWKATCLKLEATCREWKQINDKNEGIIAKLMAARG